MSEELLRKVESIYRGIKCKETDCIECQLKYNVVFCPKSYADEIRDAIKAINNSISTVDKIIEEMEK